MSDYSELKLLAESCPWEKIEGFEYSAAGGKAYCLGDGPHNHLITTFDQRFQKYLEAANPSVVLALISDYDKLACLVEVGHKLSMDAACGEIAAFEAERDELRAQVQAMRELLRKVAPHFAAPPGLGHLHADIDAALQAKP